MYVLNKNKLNGKIIERGMTKEGLAMSIGVDRTTLYRRIQNNTLRLTDIQNICRVLNLTNEEILDIFFS